MLHSIFLYGKKNRKVMAASIKVMLKTLCRFGHVVLTGPNL